MNRTLKSLVLAMSLLAPVGAFAAAADNGAPAAEHEGHHRGHMYRKIAAHASELGIPQATLDQMKAAFQAARPDFQRLRQDMEQARKEGDQAKITTAENALRDRRQALRTQIDGLLTPEQKAAIRKFVGEHRHEGKGQKEKAGG